VSRRSAAAVVVLLILGCGNIGSPEILSGDVYEFRDQEAGQTLVFHWARAELPVRVWVAGDSPLLPYVRTAIDRWQGAFLYGEFRASMVADSSIADVIVRNVPSDIGGGFGARAAQCVGETDQEIDVTARTVTLPMHVFIYPLVSQTAPGVTTCYSITATHEFGHVLGIISPIHAGTTSSDVMFANPSYDGISDRDRLTAVTLYSIPSTLTIRGRH
jgi:predicted Zn-dependent protease